MGHHHDHPGMRVSCGVITVSDSRTPDDDVSGDLAQRLLEDGGHTVTGRAIVRDEPAAIRAALEDLREREVRVAILTGGTGIAPRDQTYEAVADVIERELPGVGELFRSLSYSEIGSAAMLSRALAGVSGRLFIAALPGSPDAVRLGLERLIIPELGHIAGLLED